MLAAVFLAGTNKKAARRLPQFAFGVFYPCESVYIRGKDFLCSATAKKSDIQILHIQRVLFDELPPRLYVLAHQRGEDGLALGNVFKSH